MSTELSHALTMQPFLFMQILTTLNFIYLRYDRKKTFFWSVFVLSMLEVIYTIVLFSIGFERAQKWAFIIFTIPGLILFFVVSKYRDGRLVFAYFFTDSILSCVNYISYMICTLLIKDDPLLKVIIRFISTGIPVLLLNKYFFLNVRHLMLAKEINWNITGFFALIAGLFVYYELLIKESITYRQDELLSYLLSFSMITLIFLILVYAIERGYAVMRKNKELEMMDIQVLQAEKTYQEIMNAYEKYRFLKHDINHHLGTLNQLATNGSIEDVRKYLNALNERIPQKQSVHLCKDLQLNALLLNYQEKMELNEIDFRSKVNIDNITKETSLDLCIILGNALENALENCDGEKKIELTCIQNNQQIHITVSNSFHGNINIDDKGILVSTKQNKNSHGLGTKIIKNFIENTNGWISFNSNNGYFKMDAIFNIKI